MRKVCELYSNLTFSDKRLAVRQSSNAECEINKRYHETDKMMSLQLIVVSTDRGNIG